jgi:hypothetical protein
MEDMVKFQVEINWFLKMVKLKNSVQGSGGVLERRAIDWLERLQPRLSLIVIFSQSYNVPTLILKSNVDYGN